MKNLNILRLDSYENKSQVCTRKYISLFLTKFFNSVLILSLYGMLVTYTFNKDNSLNFATRYIFYVNDLGVQAIYTMYINTFL